MRRLLLIGIGIVVVSASAFGQDLLRRARRPNAPEARDWQEERARREAQRKAAREAALPRMQAALKEIAGVTLGQSASDALPQRGRGEWAALPKPYRYFTKINPSYEFGKLVGVCLYFETEGRYSAKSLEAEIDAVKKDIGERLGRTSAGASDATRPGLLHGSSSRTFNGWFIDVSYDPHLKALVLSIQDYTLANELRKADREAREAKLETLPVFASSNAVTAAGEKGSPKGEGARKTEDDARKEIQRQLLAIQEQLRSAGGARVRPSRGRAIASEVKRAVAAGGTAAAVEILNRHKAESATAKKKLDRLLSMAEKAKGLSPDALAIYRQKVKEAQGAYVTSTNDLAGIEAFLTPEKLAELERRKRAEDEKKARKAKAEAEFSAFEKSFAE